MKEKEALFSLIKCLSKEEKRNFMRLSAIQNGDKLYLNLFAWLEEMEEYDEGTLIRLVNDSKFKTQQLSVAKNYLQNQILRSLTTFRRRPAGEVAGKIEQAGRLLEKEQYGMAGKIIRKIRKKAREGELFHQEIDLLTLELDCLLITDKLQASRRRILQLEADLEHLQIQEANLQKLKLLFFQARLMIKSRAPIPHEAELELIRNLKEHPLLRSPEAPGSQRALMLYCRIWYYILQYEHDYEGCLKMLEKVIGIYESAERWVQEDLRGYIEELGRMTTLLTFLGRREECLACFEKMQGLKPGQLEEKKTLFKAYILSELYLSVESGETEKGLDAMAVFESEIRTSKGKLPTSRLLLFYFLCTVVYIHDGKPRQAKVWMDKFLRIPKSELRTDLQRMIRYLELVVLVDSDKFDLLENRLLSVEKYIRYRGIGSETDREVTQFFRTLLRAKDQKEQKATVSKSLNHWRELETISQEWRVFSGLFAFPVWLESKLKGVPMKEIIRKRLNSFPPEQ